jgi:hypothetical protein
MLTNNARILLKSTLLATSLFIAGCSTLSPSAPTVIEKPPLIVSSPSIIDTLPVRWIVITEDNLARIVDEQKKKGEFVVISLTPSDYKNLVSNQADILRYIQEQRVIIDAYTEYYKITPQTKK